MHFPLVIVVLCVNFSVISVCNQGLGIEQGLSLPLGFFMTSSSNKNGNIASSARLNSASSCWCASTKEGNQYLQVDFGKELTLTGMAIQGNPTANSWVKDFYFDYGRSLHSLATYQEYGKNKVSFKLYLLFKNSKNFISSIVSGKTISCYINAYPEG